MAEDKDLATTWGEDAESSSLESRGAETESEYKLPENNSSLQIKIYLGMS
jgi:hypothetical protein